MSPIALDLIEPGATALAHAEVELLNVLVVPQLGRWTGLGHLAILEDVGMVGDRQGHLCVLFDQEDAGAGSVDVGDDVSDLIDDAGRQPQ